MSTTTRNPYLLPKPKSYDFRNDPSQQYRDEKLTVLRAVVGKLLPDQFQKWRSNDRLVFNRIDAEMNSHDASWDPLARATEARQSWSNFVGSGLIPSRRRLQDFLPLVQSVHISGRILQAGAIPAIPAPTGESASVPVVTAASTLIDYALLDHAAIAEGTQQLLDDESATAVWINTILMAACDRSIENTVINSNQVSNVGILHAPNTNQTSSDFANGVSEARAKVEVVGDAQADLLVANPLTWAAFRATQDQPGKPDSEFSFGLELVLTAACPQNKAIVLNRGAVQLVCGIRDSLSIAKNWTDGQILFLFNARRSVAVVRPRAIGVVNLEGS